MLKHWSVSVLKNIEYDHFIIESDKKIQLFVRQTKVPHVKMDTGPIHVDFQYFRYKDMPV